MLDLTALLISHAQIEHTFCWHRGSKLDKTVSVTLLAEVIFETACFAITLLHIGYYSLSNNLLKN